ncbi:MAG TPA: hypothetical protein VGK73_00930, partial [Polyangiaceae bacterium]
SGEYSPFEDETITWEHEYEGSFQLEDEDGYLSVSGPVNASYLQVTTYEAPANGCSSTVTLDESISDDLDHAGFVRILTSANGSALLSVNMDGDVPVGTETTEYQGADCPDTRTTDSEGIGAPPLDVMISVTGSSASGSSDDATELTGVTTTFPDDSGARFALSWNLQLVRR